MKHETWNLFDVNFGGRAPYFKIHMTLKEIVEEQAEKMGITDKRAIKKAQDSLINDLDTYQKNMPTVYRMAKKALQSV